MENPDVILIGSGIMSAHLGALLKSLDPNLRIQLFEGASTFSPESSHGWNNAGTGHAGLCELSYTPDRAPDGTVNVAKAISIFTEFELSRQFWGYAVKAGLIKDPRAFINPVPHLSFVFGDDHVDFLRARHRALTAHPFFREMEFTTDRATLAEWAPLLTENRAPGPVAATRMRSGTDVNFGEIARRLIMWLGSQPGCVAATSHRVTDLTKTAAGWDVTVADRTTGKTRRVSAPFVFVGAGGGTLPLLQRAGIAEVRGTGGFPIGGQWLVCDNPAIVARHQAKVYGMALPEAPTMAVPHLDTRVLEGKKTLLFGPFASWTTKFLHREGRVTDLFRSVRPDNVATLVRVGLSNRDLVRYLMQQGTQSMANRLAVLRLFYPDAQANDWRLLDGGIRVQAIKESDGKAGIVHYGTEVVTTADRTLSGLLGASPGASVSVHVMLEVIRKCFPDLVASSAGRARLKAMVPTFDVDATDPENSHLVQSAAAEANAILGLHPTVD